MLRFSFHPLSLPCVKVRYFLEEAGIPYQPVSIDLAQGEQRHPDFLRRNPLGQVPFIERGDFGLAESASILRYLADREAKSDFFSPSLEERALVSQWMDYLALNVCDPLADLIWNRAWAHRFGFPVDPSITAQAEDRLARHLPTVEHHLLGRNFFCGPYLSLADVTLLPYAGNAWRAGITFVQQPQLKAWFERMSARPAWQKVNVKE